jgi:hypothetical protein
MFHALGTMAPEGAQGHKVRVRTTRGFQQPIAMHGVHPLAVEDVAFASRHGCDRLRTEETAWDAAGLEGLKQGNPRAPRRFHRSSVDAPVDEPARQSVQISGGGAKSAHQLLLVTSGHAGHDFMGANISSRRMDSELAHAITWTSCALRRADTMPVTAFAHGGALWDNHARSLQPHSLLIGVSATRVERMRDREPCWSAGRASPVPGRVSTRDRVALLYSIAV